MGKAPAFLEVRCIPVQKSQAIPTGSLEASPYHQFRFHIEFGGGFGTSKSRTQDSPKVQIAFALFPINYSLNSSI